MDFHFNAALSAVNVARKAIQQNEIYNKLMNNFMRYHYNQNLLIPFITKSVKTLSLI